MRETLCRFDASRWGHPQRFWTAISGIIAAVTLYTGLLAAWTSRQDDAELEAQFTQVIQPFMANYCGDCHAGEAVEGGVDVSKLSIAIGSDADSNPWSKPLEALKNGVMPPPEAAQPTPEERTTVVESIKRLLQKQAEVNAGDPGPVVIRRLNNIEYTNTIRALTGVASLEPAREFPPEGAAGEGFMNVGGAVKHVPGYGDQILRRCERSREARSVHADGYAILGRSL